MQYKETPGYKWLWLSFKRGFGGCGDGFGRWDGFGRFGGFSESDGFIQFNGFVFQSVFR